jgi:uncharacterized membrane protein
LPNEIPRPEPSLPPHVEETVKTIERLHAEHAARATRLQRMIDATTALVGRPGFIIGLTLVLLMWMGANLAIGWAGFHAPDPPPFNGVEAVLETLALYVTLTILASQRRADQLASRREQLTLELAIIAERKTAKVIALLEEMRRDHPELRDRVDDQAEAMSAPSDAQAVLDAIAVAHEGAEETKTALDEALDLPPTTA